MFASRHGNINESVELLERLARSPEVYPQAREVLEPLYRERGLHGPRIDLLRLGAEHAEGEERAELLRQAGEVARDEQNEPEQALDLFLASLQASPWQSDLLARTIELSTTLSAGAKVEPVLDELLAQGLAPADEITVLEALAALAVSRGDTEDEVRRLRAILEAQPERVELIDRLIELYRAGGKPAELLEVCQRKLDLPLASTERAEVLAAMAEAHTAMGDADAAEPLWLERLGILRDDMTALQALEEIYRQRGDTVSLVEVLEQQSESRRGEPPVLAELKAEIARLRGDAPGAIAALEDAVEAQPERPDLVDRLAALYEAQGLWPNLTHMLEHHLQLGLEPERAFAVHRKLGAAYAEGLQELGQAIEHYERARAIVPDDAGCVNALYALYRETGRSGDLLELQREALGKAGSESERVAILTQIVRVRLAQGERSPELLGELAEIVAADPSNRMALELLADLRAESDQAEEALALYTRALELSSEAEDLARVHRKLGRLCNGALGRNLDAQGHFRAVLDADPFDEESFTALAEIYESHGSWEALVALWTQRLNITQEPSARAACMVQIARIYLEAMKDEDTFLHWIGQARDAAPDDPEVVATLVSFHAAKGHAAALIPLLSWQAKHFEEARNFDKAAVTAHRLARLLMEAEDWAAAADHARMAARYDPENLEILLDEATALERCGEWEQARTAYQGLLMMEGRMKDEAQQAEVLFRLARVSRELQDEARMSQYLERCLDLDPSHKGALALKAER